MKLASEVNMSLVFGFIMPIPTNECLDPSIFPYPFPFKERKITLMKIHS